MVTIVRVCVRARARVCLNHYNMYNCPQIKAD